MTEYLSGGLYVVEKPQDTHWINRQLRQIDDRLFLERQLAYDGMLVWCVVCDVGLDHPPITLIEFRDDTGKPIPDPTEQLVRRVALMERDGAKLSRRVIEKNIAFQQAKTKAMCDQTAEIARDMLPRMQPTRSVLLPRGAYLRSSRDKQRAAGASI